MRQRTGEWVHDNIVKAVGYSGGPASWHDAGAAVDGRNNPDMERVPNVGPLPRGLWAMVELIPHHPTLGDYVIRLEPLEGTETWGRGDFAIHGPNAAKAPGYSSHGCPVIERPGRERIWTSGDHVVEVVRGDEPAREAIA